MRVLALLLLLCGSLAAQTTLTIQTATNLPDITDGPIGEGFTCTGICRHSNGTDWWVMAFGQSDAADVTIHSMIVHLSEDFTTNLGEINLAAFGSASAQGICRRTTDDTLWICMGASVRRYSEAGTLLTGTISPSGGCNGICYDSVNNLFYILKVNGVLFTYDATALTLVNTLTTCPATAPDHLSMVGTKVWACAGVNGSTGTIWEYDPVGNSWTQLYNLTGADCPEGCFVDGTSLYVTNDAYFHVGSPPKNRVLTYDLGGGSTDRSYVLRLPRRR